MLGLRGSAGARVGSIVKLYIDVNHVRGGTAVATAVVASNGSWVLQVPVSARGANFSGYDIVQEPTPANYYNYNVTIPFGGQRGLPVNAAFHFEMLQGDPKLSSVDGAIFWLRYTGSGPRLDSGSSIIKRPIKTTYYIGGVYEVDSDGTTRSYFGAGGASALRTSSGGVQSVLYLHGDHLGSVSLATDSTGNKASEQDFDPWGGVRSGGVGQTTRNYTGQQLDSTGLLYYHARYYDPGLARFVSADSIVPGMAAAAGGFGAIGADSSASMKGLTVDYHESGFAAAASGENAMTLHKGFYFQLSNDDKQQVKSPDGPMNSQALNRYSYVMNNPLRYTDPSGHAGGTFVIDPDAVDWFADAIDQAFEEEISNLEWWSNLIGDVVPGYEAGAAVGIASARAELHQLESDLKAAAYLAGKIGGKVVLSYDENDHLYWVQVIDAQGNVVKLPNGGYYYGGYLSHFNHDTIGEKMLKAGWNVHQKLGGGAASWCAKNGRVLPASPGENPTVDCHPSIKWLDSDLDNAAYIFCPHSQPL